MTFILLAIFFLEQENNHMSVLIRKFNEYRGVHVNSNYLRQIRGSRVWMSSVKTNILVLISALWGGNAAPPFCSSIQAYQIRTRVRVKAVVAKSSEGNATME